MSLNYRQQRQLHRIESRLRRSDPHLAAMLAVFGRLSAGQCVPAWEQIATRRDRLRQASAQIAKATAILTAAIALLVSAVLALPAALSVHRAVGMARPTHRRSRGAAGQEAPGH